MTRRNVLIRNGQATPISVGGNLSSSMMSSALPALPSVHSDQFYDTLLISTSAAMHMKSGRRKETNADALYGPGGNENFILSM